MTKPVTNADRAMWAECGLLEYAIGKEGGEDYYDAPEIVMSDLLTDLMHFAQQYDIDFSWCLKRARSHYKEELSEG